MTTAVPPHPPGAWRPARSVARRVAAPIERFVRVEAASGLVLVVAAVAALVWANTSASSYDAFLGFPLGVRAGGLDLVRPLHFWIDDGLMTLFFLLVGLEIRAELHDGELSTPRRAALPVFAALGGMVAPALVFLALNARGGAPRGWGAPIATDIAFALGVLTLLGRRVSPGLRVLLLALAVLDDVGAILVIAAFYSGHLAVGGLLLAAGATALVLGLRLFGVRSTPAYVAAGVVLWAG
ncbi:MAG TPA: Na+/H+ antiporter NhaA, partial [Minicystis sp.]|nr:Na+/H+ antiporter NhaA [Minicystis sp.]